jgi:hypothetical protein
MSVSRSISFAARGVCLAVATASLAGCGLSTKQIISTFANIPVSGNWQVSSKSPLAGDLPAFSGSFQGTGASFTGIMHSNWAGSCISPSVSFPVVGATNDKGVVFITNDNILGGILSITGNLAPDGKSITNASYTISGGNCSFDAAAPAQANLYQPISGTYKGDFYDAYGDDVGTLTAPLTQSPPDSTNGNYTLSSSGATFGPSNPCFASLTLAGASVTGGSFSFNFNDTASTGNTVAVAGTFSTDGTTLTITSWVLTPGSGASPDCQSDSNSTTTPTVLTLQPS